MSGSTITDLMVMESGPDEAAVNHISGQIDVDFAKCDCCGLTEECTLFYIQTIRERYGGKWICGLCSEAVKDESLRCEKLLTPDEAMARHSTFCNKFRASSPPQDDPALRLISAMRHILMKVLESPRSLPSSPRNKRTQLRNMTKESVLIRSESCMPSLTIVDHASVNEV